MNDIKTWQQGGFAPQGKHGFSEDEAKLIHQQEKHMVRPGLRENAICSCPKPSDAVWIAERLNLASQLEQMAYDYAMGKADGSDLVAFVKNAVS